MNAAGGADAQPTGGRPRDDLDASGQEQSTGQRALANQLNSLQVDSDDAAERQTNHSQRAARVDGVAVVGLPRQHSAAREQSNNRLMPPQMDRQSEGRLPVISLEHESPDVRFSQNQTFSQLILDSDNVSQQTGAGAMQLQPIEVAQPLYDESEDQLRTDLALLGENNADVATARNEANQDQA